MRSRIISSLEKCFPDETVLQKKPLEHASCLKNEIFSFQICYDWEQPLNEKNYAFFHIESPLADKITVYNVRYIPSFFPCYGENTDDNYLRREPGLFPDLLEPAGTYNRVSVTNNLNALWFEVTPDNDIAPGKYPITCCFTDNDGNTLSQATVTLEIIDALLPEQNLIYTQWVYTDCLMQYYNTGAFDEAHWQIIENYLRQARKYGINMILTPVLTPPLDTAVGGERPTTQLVEITVNNGKYEFDFSRLGRWVDLCDEIGIRYFEINHFFTQWGAAFCPKVIATVDGVQKRIFGWDTPSDGPEYTAFLQALIPQMLQYLREKNGADRRCYFHISDEPVKEQLDQYARVFSILRPLLKGYPIMDALSDYAFYEKGYIDCPVPANDHIDEFLKHDIPHLWTYYCCVQAKDVSNRFFAMPSARNRIIGTQLYKYNIEGFLHWGYNFYNNQFSLARINPFACSDGECFAPSGDCFSVYPGHDGKPWPSLRQIVFYEAIQDLRALQLCESLYGRDATLELLEADITFRSYPKDPEYILNLRERINQAIAKYGH